MALNTPDWSGSEEDHLFRSEAIQWMLHQPTGDDGRLAAPTIPRVIVRYWHDLATIPADVDECLKSWESLTSQGFDLRLFDDKSARRYVAEHFEDSHVGAFDRCYHPAMRCDFFRLCYVLRQGGMYVDADEVYAGDGCESLFRDNKLKLQPLCYDLSTQQMVPAPDYFRDNDRCSSRIYYVNNNPITAPPGHPLLACALERATRLLSGAVMRPEIQSTTGPGNMSASLVRHVKSLQLNNLQWDFTILRDWNDVSECRWFLSYRNDARNWRLANGHITDPSQNPCDGVEKRR